MFIFRYMRGRNFQKNWLSVPTAGAERSPESGDSAEFRRW